MELSPDVKKGRPIQLTANYFKILCNPEWCLYQYRVSFVPEEDRAIRQQTLIANSDKLGSYILDGTTLYSAISLAEFDKPLELLVDSPEHIKYRIIIELHGEMAPGDPHYLQVYNNLLQQCMKSLKYQLIGNNYYDSNSIVRINDYSLEVWPGYLTSIQQLEDGVFICADVIHKVMGQESVLNILERLLEKYGDEYQEPFAIEVIGLSVWTEYNNKIYKINGIDFSLTPISNIQTSKSILNMTYKEFYKDEYGINVYENSQPMLVVDNVPRDRHGQTETIFLVPELCGVVGLTTTQKNDANIKLLVSSHTAVIPESRINKLGAFNDRLNKNVNIRNAFEGWNMRLDSNLVSLVGKVLPNEKLIFGNGCQVDTEEGDWTSAFKEKHLYYTVKLKNWIILTPRNYAFEVQNFVAEMMKSTRNFHLSEPYYIELEHSTPESYSFHLEKSITDLNPQLIMVVVQGRRPEIFTLVMRKCYVDYAIPCQVITDKCFTSDDYEAIATKVAIQLNCKIGGIPWSIHIPLSGLMIIGFDVGHDTDQRNKCFGAMVASLDKNLTRYFSAVSSHETGEQLTTNFITNITKALDKYREVNEASLPTRIIIYRSGVQEGQVGAVTEHEVTRIHNAICRVYGKAASVNLAYILTSIYSQTKLFTGFENPPSGTVVDSTITHPIRKDFYLVSHMMKDDTVIPTYYNIVFDSFHLSTERIQILTYKLTHMYFNCSNSIRVPSVAQYAHKLAVLVSQSIHVSPNSRLEDLLYFL